MIPDVQVVWKDFSILRGGVSGRCTANGIERNDWRGGTDSDAIIALPCSFWFLVGRNMVFSGHYLLICKYQVIFIPL